MRAGLGVAALAGVLSFAPAGRAQIVDEPSPAGLESMVECLARTQRLAAVVLVDESSSLKTTDRQNLRVGMVEALVDAVVNISRVPIDGVESELSLAVVGFSSTVNSTGGQPASVADWLTVTPETEDTVSATILGFADRLSGSETDYVTALTVAQDLLIQRQAESGVASGELCTAILWFTDGKFDLGQNSQSRTWTADLDLRNSSADKLEAIRRGTELLCRSGGVADQLRSASTYLLTFALLSDRFEGTDEALLQRVTLGADGCGAIDASSTGAYFPGRVPDGIADCFYLALLGQGCPPEPAKPDECSSSGPCVREFIIDDAIDLVRLEYTALPSLANVVLRAPSGEVIPLGDDAVSRLDGVEIRVSSATRAGFATLFVDQGNAAAHGRWRVINQPSEPGSLDLTVIATPSYRLRLDVPDEAVRGEAVTFTATVTGRSGQPVDPNTVKGLEGINFVIVDGANELIVEATRTADGGSFSAAVVLPLEGDALTAEIAAQGSINTADGSTSELRSPLKSMELVAPGFIRVANSLDFGTLNAERRPDQEDDHSQFPLPLEAEVGAIELRAPRDVGGTACLGSPEWTIDRVTLSLAPDQECVTLEAGESGIVRLTLRFAEPEAGPLSGTLPVTVRSDLDGSERIVRVALNGQVRIPPAVPWANEGIRVLFLILGILLPAAAYVAAAVRLSRFETPSVVQMTTHPITLNPYGVDVGRAISSSGESSGFVFLEGSDDRLQHAKDLTFQAPRRIVREPTAVVKSSAASVLVTSLHRSPQTGTAEIGHELNGSWVYRPKGAEGDTVVGEISVLTRDGQHPRATADYIIRQAESDLSGLREELIGLLSGVSGGDSDESSDDSEVDSGDYKW